MTAAVGLHAWPWMPIVKAETSLVSTVAMWESGDGSMNNCGGLILCLGPWPTQWKSPSWMARATTNEVAAAVESIDGNS